MKFFKASSAFHLIAVNRELLSPKQYMELSRTRPDDIKRATYVTPQIGKPGFGAFEVEYYSAKLVPGK
jgi:hypothetical protein